MLSASPAWSIGTNSEADASELFKSEPAVAHLHAAYAKQPLAFEENTGQLDRGIRFLARGPGYRVYLKDGGMALAVAGKGAEAKPLELRFVGASRSARWETLEKLATKTNYLIGADPSRHRTDIGNYARVKQRAVYPGIDVIYYGNQRDIEHDFVLAPGADPSQIRLQLRGHTHVRISAEGDLVLGTASGELRLHRPVAYQMMAGERKPVDAKYRLVQEGKTARVTFDLARYDGASTLWIDPILSYSTYLGGSGGDVAMGAAVDGSGNAYIVGWTTSSDFPVVGGVQTKKAGDRDVFVAKLNATGSGLIYSTYLGVRRSSSSGYAIAVDAQGNAYITGTSDSSSFPTTPGAYQTTGSGTFVAKLNASGNALVFSTRLAGTTPKAIAVDAAGSAYLTGIAYGTFAPTPGALQPASRGMFVAKLAPAGNVLAYGTFLGGSGSDAAKSIAVDSSGRAVVVGTTSSADFPTANAFQPAIRGGTDGFVAKLSEGGNSLVFSTFLGGTSNDAANAVALDGNGRIYVAGDTYSNDFHVLNAFQSSKGHSDTEVNNAFVTKMSESGTSLIYSSYLGGKACLGPGVSSCLFTPPVDGATAIAVDAADNAFVAGYARSVTFPLEYPMQAKPPAGSSIALPFVTKVNASGNGKVFSVVLGDMADDQAVRSIAVDPAGNVYVLGALAGRYFPTTAGAFQASGLQESVVFKLSPGMDTVKVSSSGNPVTENQTIILTATVAGGSPSQTVSFQDGAAVLGTAPVVAGIASLSTTLPAGIRRITATYSGDGKTSRPYYQMINRDGICQ